MLRGQGECPAGEREFTRRRAGIRVRGRNENVKGVRRDTESFASSTKSRLSRSWRSRLW